MSNGSKQKAMAPVRSREQNREWNKGGRGQVTAFYIETLVLAVIFVAVILVLLRVFSLSMRLSGQAKELTSAVRLAENAAEAAAASDNVQELALLLDENGNVTAREDGSVLAEYDRDMKPAPGGEIRMEITWEPEETGCVGCTITVSRKKDSQLIYTLNTAVYAEEAVP